MTSFDVRNPLMTVHRVLRWLFAAAALTGAPFVAAADFSLGVGAGTDRGRVDCVISFPCDRSSSHWKLFAAYRVSETIDVQAVYFDAGRFEGGGTTPLGTEFGGSFKVSGFGLTGGYRWPLAQAWSLDARAGVAAVRTRFDYVDASFGSAHKTNLQPLAGLSLVYTITPSLRLSLDHDVTRFKVHTTRGSLRMSGLGAQYAF